MRLCCMEGKTEINAMLQCGRARLEGVKGIENGDKWCFLIVVVHLLKNCDRFEREIVENEPNGRITEGIKAVFDVLNDRSVFRVSRQSLERLVSTLGGLEQLQSSGEESAPLFLRNLLAKLALEVPFVVSNNFQVKTAQITEIGTKPFKSLITLLKIPPGRGFITFERLISHTFGSRKQFLHLPTHLVFVIDRVQKDQNRYKKVHTSVEIPVEFSFAPYCAPQYSADGQTYRVSSIVEHKGSRVLSGHYTIMVKSTQSLNWFCLDDEKVSEQVAGAVVTSKNAEIVTFSRIGKEKRTFSIKKDRTCWTFFSSWF